MKMKLVRLATLYFEPAPKQWRSWSLHIGQAEVETMGSWDLEGKLRLLVAAGIRLSEPPLLTPDALVVVPEKERRHAKAAIETAANIIAVTERCKRSISSPMPFIALVPEDQESRSWLDGANGFIANIQTLPGFQLRIEIDDTMLGSLEHRLDGVALLAEALSHSHAMGKFHEFLRLFERAFKLSSSELVKPLAQFLTGANRGYTVEEVTKWVVELRHPATHADWRPNFVTESDVRPVIQRMEQAAYDVLFNKAEWRSRSAERMNIWSPPAGTLADSAGFFVVQGSELRLLFQLLDDFGSYPLDLSAGIDMLPQGWWSERFHREKQVKPP
jgi:hypothetical protein